MGCRLLGNEFWIYRFWIQYIVREKEREREKRRARGRLWRPGGVYIAAHGDAAEAAAGQPGAALTNQGKRRGE